MKLKLAIIAPALSVHTHKWVRALSEHHEVSLITLLGHKTDESVFPSDVTIHYLPFAGKLSYYTNFLALKKLINRENFDLINVHYASGYGTLTRLAGVKPYILNFWGSDIYEFPKKSPLHKKIIQKNIMESSEVIVTSHNMEKELNTSFANGLPEVTVVPFGVEIERFEFKQRSLNSDCIRFGTCKILSQNYAVDDMIKAFAKAKPDIENTGRRAELHIYGDGPEKNNLEQLAKSLGVSDSVFFYGWVDHSEIPGVLYSLDVFLLTSIKESFGVAAIEAMATGLPVIATDTMGFSEVIEDGVSGLIVPIHGIDQMVSAINRLVNDNELYQSISQAGRLRVEANYIWDQNIAQALDRIAEYPRRATR